MSKNYSKNLRRKAGSIVLAGFIAGLSSHALAAEPQIIPNTTQTNNFVDPFRQMDLMERQMNQLFESAIKDMRQQSQMFHQFNAPSMNKDSLMIKDGQDEYTIQFKMPGTGKGEHQFDVGVDGRQLTIMGSSKSKPDSNSNSQGYFSSNFVRSFTLPADVDVKSMQTKPENGYLTIKFKKKTQKSAA